YLGGRGDDQGTAIAVDGEGNAYVTGSTTSSDFPITPGALQDKKSGAGKAFVSKLNATGTALLYTTYLGGSGFESGKGIAVDREGDAYVIGNTYSSDFPATP